MLPGRPVRRNRRTRKGKVIEMENETQKQEGVMGTAGVPTEHAVMLVPFNVMQAISTYLTTKPYNEVAQFIQVLSQIQAQDVRKIKGK